MEINLDNAFFIVIKLTIGRFATSLDGVTQTVHAFIQRQAFKALEKPIVTTLVSSCILMVLICTLTMSILVTAAVFCAVVIIIIVEGFVLGVVVAMAAAITLSMFSAAIIIFGVFSPRKQKV